MKKHLFLLLTLLLFFTSLNADTSINGSLKIDLRSMFKKPYCNFYNREDILTLKLSSDISDNVSFYTSVEGRYFDATKVASFEDTQVREKVDPVEFDIWESYITVNSIIFENMDATLGKQVVEWGTADMLNPTSTLNPHDLSDPLDFSKRIPITMFNFNYYPDNDYFNKIQAVWIPAHKPALFPNMEMPMKMKVPEPGEIKQIEENGLFPQDNPFLQIFANKFSITRETNEYVHHNPFYPKYSESGIRLSFNFFETDFHLSYFNGYSEFPLPRRVKITIANHDELNKTIEKELEGVAPGNKIGVGAAILAGDQLPVDIRTDVTLAYPHYHVIGADFKADISGIGVWGEAGYFIPYKFDITYIYPDSNWMLTNGMTELVNNHQFTIKYKSSELPFLDRPFLKYTLGAEYIFKGGYHLEAQFARGFFFEQGATNLNDYLMLEFDKSFLEGKFKFSLAGGGSVEGGTLIHLIKYGKLQDDISTGIFGGPKLEYLPYDGIDIALGAIFMGGSGNSFFAKMKDMQQVYLQAETDF